jgi:hypothetical protein
MRLHKHVHFYYAGAQNLSHFLDNLDKGLMYIMREQSLFLFTGVVNENTLKS